MTVAGGSSVFNADGVSEVRAVTTGVLNSAGNVSNAVVLLTNGEGVPAGKCPLQSACPIACRFFPGTAVWTGNSSSSWGSDSNWTDSNGSGVQARPGPWAIRDGDAGRHRWHKHHRSTSTTVRRNWPP